MRIDRNSLLPMLAHAAECADKRDSITACVRIDCTASTVTVHATDYEVSGSATAPCDGDGEWSVCVPAVTLLRQIGTLPDGATVTLRLADGARLAIEAGRSRYAIAGKPASEFPEVAEPVTGGVALDTAALRQLFVRAAYCVSMDDGRPAITGVYLQGDGEALRATATDGHRLATATMAAPGLTITAILHRRALLALLKMLATAPTVWLVSEGRNLVWHTRDTTLTARRIEATFPDWTKVVPDPAGYGGSVTVAADVMLAELSRVTPLLPSRDAIVRLTWTGDGIALDGTGEHGDAHAELDAAVHAPVACQTLGLNPAYLRDAVKALGGAVTMAVRDSVSPVLLTSDAAGAAQCVLMPCRT